jgi:hypothetical protein
MVCHWWCDGSSSRSSITTTTTVVVVVVVTMMMISIRIFFNWQYEANPFKGVQHIGREEYESGETGW